MTTQKYRVGLRVLSHESRDYAPGDPIEFAPDFPQAIIDHFLSLGDLVKEDPPTKTTATKE